MKKFMNSLIVTLLLLLTTLRVSAIDVVTSLATNDTQSVASSGIYIASVTIQNATGVTDTVRLIDAPSTSLTYTRGSFTVPTSYTTNYVSTYTNINGVVTSVTNSALFTLNTTVAATTNSYRTINLFTVPANTTVTWTPVNGAYTVYGLLVTNNAVSTMTTSYAPIRP